MRRSSIVAALLGLLAGLFLAVAPSAQAESIGMQGCTPGYWKNHTSNWQEAQPTTLFSDRFSDGTSGVLAGKTFLDTLQGGGGTGVSGAELILARAATAAYLNAAHEGVGYPWRRDSKGLDGRPALVKTVVAALESGNRSKMLALAKRLDADNNLGCPLS